MIELGVEGSIWGLARAVDFIRVLEVGVAEAKSGALGANLHLLTLPPDPFFTETEIIAKHAEL